MSAFIVELTWDGLHESHNAFAIKAAVLDQKKAFISRGNPRNIHGKTFLQVKTHLASDVSGKSESFPVNCMFKAFKSRLFQPHIRKVVREIM